MASYCHTETSSYILASIQIMLKLILLIFHRTRGKLQFLAEHTCGQEGEG